MEDDRLIEAGMAGRLRPGTPEYEHFIDITARRPTGQVGTARYRDAKHHERSFEIALEALRLTPEDRYLELGFGGGQLLERVLRVVASAAGIDHSPDMLALACERNVDAVVAGRLQLVYGDVHRLPWADAEFTCAAAVNMFFFVQQPERFLAEIHRVLRPRGRLVIVTAAPAPEGGPSEPWRAALRVYPAEIMEDMVRTAGFASVQVEEREGYSQVVRAVND
jgi:ubiquinone/menaquinone biosynthesis C-methylase UbiE